MLRPNGGRLVSRYLFSNTALASFLISFVAMIGSVGQHGTQRAASQPGAPSVERVVTIEQLNFAWLDDSGSFRWVASVRNRSERHVDVTARLDLVQGVGTVADSDSTVVRLQPNTSRDVVREVHREASGRVPNDSLAVRASIEWRLAGIGGDSPVVHFPSAYADADVHSIGVAVSFDTRTIVIATQDARRVSLDGWSLVNSATGSRVVFRDVSIGLGDRLFVVSPKQSDADFDGPVTFWNGLDSLGPDDSVELYDAAGLLRARSQ